jgi:hypothetical protein
VTLLNSLLQMHNTVLHLSTEVKQITAASLGACELITSGALSGQPVYQVL